MVNKKIAIIDYGIGNHQSVINALTFLGYDFFVSSRIKDIRKADIYILPGVGAFAEAMKNLRNLDIINLLNEEVLIKKKPILGICLGMQILASDSQEDGFHKGLGWIDAHVVKLEAKEGFRIPHVGWNSIHIIKKVPIFSKTHENTNFYFDHSYHFACKEELVTATCYYGEHIVVAVQKENIFGVQFHPEKSQVNGLRLFRCFLNYVESIEKVSSYV